MEVFLDDEPVVVQVASLEDHQPAQLGAMHPACLPRASAITATLLGSLGSFYSISLPPPPEEIATPPTLPYPTPGVNIYAKHCTGNCPLRGHKNRDISLELPVLVQYLKALWCMLLGDTFFS